MEMHSIAQHVAILILLELTLQSMNDIILYGDNMSRNPYFIGINSAINMMMITQQSLVSRNPYFIGINSAIIWHTTNNYCIISRNPYFIGINSAMKNK